MAERLAPIDHEIIALLPSLRAFAHVLTQNRADADDLVQETLTRALARIHQYAPGTNLRAWLFTIQRNTFITGYHKRVREPVLAVDELPWVQVDASQEWTQMLKDVDRAMQKLSADKREALMLVGGAGLNYDEAAELCGCAIGTIKSRVSRARAELEQLLAGSEESSPLSGALRQGQPAPAPQNDWRRPTGRQAIRSSR